MNTEAENIIKMMVEDCEANIGYDVPIVVEEYAEYIMRLAPEVVKLYVEDFAPEGSSVLRLQIVLEGKENRLGLPLTHEYWSEYGTVTDLSATPSENLGAEA